MILLPLLLVWLAAISSAIFFAINEEFTIAAIYNATQLIIATIILTTRGLG